MDARSLIYFVCQTPYGIRHLNDREDFDHNTVTSLYPELPAWAWPGGYPMYYCNYRTQAIYCPRCAMEHLHETNFEHGVNWENPALSCECCGVRIPSAYAEDDVI